VIAPTARRTPTVKNDEERASPASDPSFTRKVELSFQWALAALPALMLVYAALWTLKQVLDGLIQR